MKIILKKVPGGVVAVGQYQAGVEYDVEDKEAQRLIEVKGFEKVAEEKPAPKAAPKPVEEN